MKTVKDVLLMTSVILVHVNLFTSASEDVVYHEHLISIDRHFNDNPAINHTILYGPRKDYYELQQMPLETQRLRVKNLAKAHDLNGNGIIEREEMRKWIVEALRIVHHHDAEDELKRLDKNRDGVLTRTEAVYLKDETTEEEMAGIEHKAAKGKELNNIEKSLILHVTNNNKRFTAADMNKDGKLNMEEFQPYSQPYNYPRMRELELSLSINNMDNNKDGFITKNEFITVEDTKLHQRFLGDKFHELDNNKDEKLTREEIMWFMLPDEIGGLEEEVENVMKEADHDRNGKVTIAEIIDTEEIARGLATNFGHHLHFVRDEL